jgi:hypothetical protein
MPVALLARNSRDYHAWLSSGLLTSSIAARLYCYYGIAFQSPRRRGARGFPFQRLVGCSRGLEVEVLAGLARLDGSTDGELRDC